MSQWSTTLNVSRGITLYVFECPDCGIAFGIPSDYDQSRRDDCRGFYCPNGHVLSYRESAAQRERKQRERIERQLANVQEDLRAARASAIALKGQVTKAKKRAANGVCPHPDCHRSFVDVARHVRTKHPELVQPTSD